MIKISVIRKGAFKRLTFSTTRDCYLSILQIFETTNDVVDYQVAEIDEKYNHKDMYLSNIKGFPKWKSIE